MKRDHLLGFFQPNEFTPKVSVYQPRDIWAEYKARAEQEIRDRHNREIDRRETRRLDSATKKISITTSSGRIAKGWFDAGYAVKFQVTDPIPHWVPVIDKYCCMWLDEFVYERGERTSSPSDYKTLT